MGERMMHRYRELLAIFLVSQLSSHASCGAETVPSGNRLDCDVEIEEIVTRYAPANNGAGPLWCYGSPLLVRQKEEVFLSVLETGPNVPPLLNTRWQLWHRSGGVWRLAQQEAEYCEREPCPLAAFHRGPVFLSVNPSAEPAGATHGRCAPQVLEFDGGAPARAPRVHLPVWADGTRFTEHSYRGLAADGARGELLLLNINADTGVQFVSWRDREGVWHAQGKITFPIRACYPQVALRNGAAHVLAIGDIVEPVAEWKQLKYEKLKNTWDYVFRRLFYAYTPDIQKAPFCAPVEIDTVEDTGGHILNLDLYVDDAGAAHLLYLKRLFQYDFLRDKCFPGRPLEASLEYAMVRDGQVRARATLLKQVEEQEGLRPSYARFHVTAGRDLGMVLAGTPVPGPTGAFGNFLGRIDGTNGLRGLQRLDLSHPFHTFFTNTIRGGSPPSDRIDLFGTADDGPNLRYARLHWRR
jgi:hypothetical protein